MSEAGVGGCGLCGSSDSRVLFDAVDRRFSAHACFRWVRCSGCTLIRLEPRPAPEEVLSLYPAGYDCYASAVDAPRSGLGRLIAWERQRGRDRKCREVVARARVAAGRGRLLDVGCGSGDFLVAMQRRGWHVEGVEINPAVAGQVRARFGLTVHAGDLAEAELAPGSFDVVTLWDVVEHLAEPVESLRRARRLLRTGGLLVVATPNCESVDARLFGPYWAGLDAPRHVAIFSRTTLRQALATAGFWVEEIRCFSGSSYVFLTSLRWLLAEKVADGPGRRLAERGLQSLPVRALLWPYCRAVERAGRGSVMTAFSRPEDN